jgi:hypothetical protein
MIKETSTYDDWRVTYGYRYIENCAKTYGNTFYATNVFSDVKEGKFYEIPVAWAYGKGITSGKDDTHFAPNETCTRAQVVTFLWNAMGKPKATITTCPFVDVKPGKFYYDAMLWALQTGVTSGKDDTHFAPQRDLYPRPGRHLPLERDGQAESHPHQLPLRGREARQVLL